MKLSLFFFSIILFISLNTVSGQAFKLRGDTLVGEHPGDSYGYSVSMNSEGDILAIGAPSNSDNGPSVGRVQVFRWDGASWVQMGQDIDGISSKTEAGGSVHLNDSGNVIIIGSPSYSGVDSKRGLVQVYFWNGMDWMPRGLSINGPTAGSLAGSSVSISGDGQTIAFGAPRSFSSSLSGWPGQVRVYQWSGSAWVLKGNVFEGPNRQAWMGHSVDLSYDGNTLAFSVPGENTSLYKGVVRVYDWNGSAWSLKGNKMEVGTVGGFSLHNVSLSNDGNTIAVSDPHFQDSVNIVGRARIYDLINNVWQQRGNDLVGKNIRDDFGIAIDLADDGNNLVVGAMRHQRTLSNSSITGYARAYKWTGTNWDSVGRVNGQQGYLNFGGAVSINKYGNTIAVGEVNLASNPVAGQVRVFALDCGIQATVADSSPVFVANYAGGRYQWYRCDSSGYTLLAGEISQRFEASQNGQYAVVVKDSNCVDTSACIAAYNVGISERSPAFFELYPNPTTNNCTLFIPENITNAGLRLFDATGRLLQSIIVEQEGKQNLALPAAAGVYWVQLSTQHCQHTVRVLKIE